jgi:hypothetical protein
MTCIGRNRLWPQVGAIDRNCPTGHRLRVWLATLVNATCSDYDYQHEQEQEQELGLLRAAGDVMVLFQ